MLRNLNTRSTFPSFPTRFWMKKGDPKSLHITITAITTMGIRSTMLASKEATRSKLRFQNRYHQLTRGTVITGTFTTLSTFSTVTLSMSYPFETAPLSASTTRAFSQNNAAA